MISRARAYAHVCKDALCAPSGNIPEEEESAFRGHNLLISELRNSPGNKTGGKQASYRLKE